MTLSRWTRCSCGAVAELLLHPHCTSPACRWYDAQTLDEWAALGYPGPETVRVEYGAGEASVYVWGPP